MCIDWAFAAKPTLKTRMRWGKNQWVQAHDVRTGWYNARIRDVRGEPPDEVLVHYHGWPRSHDEWLPASSDRIIGSAKYARFLALLRHEDELISSGDCAAEHAAAAIDAPVCRRVCPVCTSD